MKQKQLTLRVPDALKPEAILIVMQTAAGHVPTATAAAKRNALRNGFDLQTLTEADIRAAIQFIQLATTAALAEFTAPAGIVSGGSTALIQFSEIDGGE